VAGRSRPAKPRSGWTTWRSPVPTRAELSDWEQRFAAAGVICTPAAPAKSIPGAAVAVFRDPTTSSSSCSSNRDSTHRRQGHSLERAMPPICIFNDRYQLMAVIRSDQHVLSWRGRVLAQGCGVYDCLDLKATSSS
jgi:hypothetical protein